MYFKKKRTSGVSIVMLWSIVVGEFGKESLFIIFPLDSSDFDKFDKFDDLLFFKKKFKIYKYKKSIKIEKKSKNNSKNN